MRANTPVWRALALVAVLALIAAACGEGEEDGGGGGVPGDTAPAEGEPVKVGELAYYTGPFAPYGESLTADVRFPIYEVINLDPPLGRPWETYHEDIGTVGEAQAARKLVEQIGVDILVSPAHEYRTYRDYMLGVLEEEDRPLMPTVHGGTIPKNIGGTGTEPIFRAQGLDEGLGTFGVLYAEQIGVQSIVVFATQVEGFQLAADAAEAAAEETGIQVLARLDAQAEQPSYRTEAERIADLQPDAVIVQAGSVESATLIKQAAEAGLSLNWIGETGWIQPEFIGTLTAAPIATQENIGFAAFGANKDTPAWEFYQPLWDENPEYNQYGPATDQYHFSTYDLLIITALAVEHAGSYDASAWAPAMFEVTDPPGTTCYTYAECLELIRAGEDIDYEGITGPGTFTEGGVNAVTPVVTLFNDDGTVGEEIPVDANRALEIIEAIAVEAPPDW